MWPLVLGAPGGSRIPTEVLSVLQGVVDYGLTLQQAVDAPRLHMQYLPDTVYLEPDALAPETKAALVKAGYNFTEQHPWGTERGHRGDARWLAAGSDGRATTRGESGCGEVKSFFLEKREPSMTIERRVSLADPMVYYRKVPYRVLLDNLTFDLKMLASARQYCESEAVQGTWALEHDVVHALVTVCFRFERLMEAQAFLRAIPGSYRVSNHPNIAVEFQAIMDKVRNSTNPDEALRKQENIQKLVDFGLATGPERAQITRGSDDRRRRLCGWFAASTGAGWPLAMARWNWSTAWRQRMTVLLIYMAGGVICYLINRAYEGAGLGASATGLLVTIAAVFLLNILSKRFMRTRPSLRQAYDARIAEDYGSIDRLKYAIQAQRAC